MKPELFVLLREGNPDCACGEELVGLTDSVEIAEAWLKAEPEALYDRVEINDLSVDGRTRFALAVKTILAKRKQLYDAAKAAGGALGTTPISLLLKD